MSRQSHFSSNSKFASYCCRNKNPHIDNSGCSVWTGGEGDGNWVMPDILVNVIRPGEDPHIGVVREVMMVSVCSLLLTQELTWMLRCSRMTSTVVFFAGWVLSCSSWISGG